MSVFSDRKMAQLQNPGSLPNCLAAFDPEDSRAELGRRSAKLQAYNWWWVLVQRCTKTAVRRRRPGCRAILKMANCKAWQPSKLVGSLRKNAAKMIVATSKMADCKQSPA
ncbi:MAG: hypothetical protein B7Z73_16365 [Planctomycetia bacterium 21-64-5]|nr:MAG: hypothetical protein B7Z73_16365 [Planctomycetia bacterium 21-64-5]